MKICSESAPPRQGCTTDADCASAGICVPDGTCAMAMQLAFVDSSGSDNASCSRDSPCRTIAAALTTSLPYIRLHGTFDERIDIKDGRHVTLFAGPGTTLTSTTPDFPVVHVVGAGTSVAIYDLRIAEVMPRVNVIDIAPASGNPSLALHHVTLQRNVGLAISIGDGQFSMDRVTLDHNAGGGLAIFGAAQFIVTNSLVSSNGSPTSSYGGIWVSVDASGHNFLEHITGYGNISARGTSPGISCTGEQSVIIDSMSIANGLSGSTTSQITGNCQVNFTLVYPGAPPDGIANLGADPKLVDPKAGDYHPSPSSPAIGATDPDPMTPPAETAWDLDDKLRSCKPAIGALEPASTPPAP